MLESKSCSESPTRSVRRSANYSYPRTSAESTIRNSSVARQPLMESLSTRERCWAHSMKLPDQSGRASRDTAGPGDRRWHVEFHPKVAKFIVAHGDIASNAFRPSICDLIEALEVDPKQYPRKKGKLQAFRAASLT
jgi:hypothetical protein